MGCRQSEVLCLCIESLAQLSSWGPGNSLTGRWFLYLFPKWQGL